MKNIIISLIVPLVLLVIVIIVTKSDGFGYPCEWDGLTMGIFGGYWLAFSLTWLIMVIKAEKHDRHNN